MSSIRVLTAGDHSSFRQNLRQVCELEEGLEVVGEAGNACEVVALAHELHPDVVLIDVDLASPDGVQAIRLITAQSSSTRVIALTRCPKDERILRAIRAGANSCLCKDVAKSALTEAVRAVHRGEALVDPVVTAVVFDGLRRVGEKLA